MEGTTEPILVVIGNPIAGNPMQFAIERSLRALELDWRVLSFDVTPENVWAAINGFAVTGIVGVHIARDLSASAEGWNAKLKGESRGTVDCLWRDDQDEFLGEDQSLRWLEAQIEKFSEGRQIWIGEEEASLQLNRQAFEVIPDPTSDLSQTLSEASVIILNTGPEDEIEWDVDDWPEDPGETLVVDLGIPSSVSSDLRELGYLVIGEDEFQIGSLQFSLARWAGKTPSDDVVIDAIEEYLSV